MSNRSAPGDGDFSLHIVDGEENDILWNTEVLTESYFLPETKEGEITV